MKAKPSINNYLTGVNKGLKENETGFQEVNGKNLYNKFLDTQNSAITEINLSEPHSIVYLLYIDCKDLEDFKEKYQLKRPSESYIGYYYSHEGSEVKSFDFKMAYVDGECDAALSGFHEEKRQDPFTGTGKNKSKNLFINLTNREEVELKLIIPIEGNQIQSQHYLLGVLTTITSDDFPISVRFFSSCQG